MDVKPFSESDLRHLRGKRHDAVALLFVEERNSDVVAKRLLTTAGSLRVMVSRARQQLADHGVILRDRRFAPSPGNPVVVFSSSHFAM